MQEMPSATDIFPEKARGLASRESSISNDHVDAMIDCFRRLVEDEELDPKSEIERLMEGLR